MNQEEAPSQEKSGLKEKRVEQKAVQNQLSQLQPSHCNDSGEQARDKRRLEHKYEELAVEIDLAHEALDQFSPREL